MSNEKEPGVGPGTSAAAMNDIPVLQNAEAGLKLMRAREATYAAATRVQHLQLVITLAIPVVGAVLGLMSPTWRPYIAALSLIISFLDAAVLDRLQRKRLQTAAKIAEQFDTEVLAIPWNAFVAGKRLDPELIDEAASVWSGEARKRLILDWYPPVVGAAPLHLARIICQRTNLWYDSRLRRRYGSAVLAIAFALTASLFIAGLALQMTLIDFVAAVLAPASPVLIWSIREYFRQKDTADAQETVKSEAEVLWERVKAGGCGEDECLDRAREFQNSIYTRRVVSPLLFPFLYRMSRNSMEARMKVGAEQMLKQAGVAV